MDAVLGRGAMGIIYKAHDPAIGRTVAIKLVRADLLSGQGRDDYLARFQREAQAAGRCLHPNIVTIYDFALHEGNPFLAMEYVEGASLDAALPQGGFGRDDAVAVGAQVLDALTCAHGLGVVHRDIKPANVLLQSNGHVKVMDFGISRLEDTSLTQDGSMIGTPSYMSPEQCRGGPVDGRSDLFSTGVLLYELLTGEKPFRGKSFTEVITQLLQHDPPDLALRLGPDGAAVAAVVSRALQKRPSDRFAGAAEMVAALRAARADAAPQHTVFVPAETIIASQKASSAAALGPEGLDAALLGTLQSRLAEHVGPIARLMLSSAIKSSASLEALCSSLAAKIDSETARHEFMVAVRRDVSLHASRIATAQRTSVAAGGPASGAAATSPGAPAAATASAIPPEVVERVQAALTRHVGPIARILVRRALQQATTHGELLSALATHVEAQADRAAFLAAAG